MHKVDIVYEIQAQAERPRTFEFSLDPETLTMDRPPPEATPAWAALDFHQCRGCPLSVENEAYCPLAVHLHDLASRFGHLISFQQVHLVVTTPERRVVQETTAQRAMCSLLGLLMAVSGCPVTEYFRPMARFHLPLASEVETIYRATSMYLLAQYFRRLHGAETKLDLAGLAAIYAKMRAVNRGIANRLRAAIDTDAAVGGVVILDMYAVAVPLVVDDALVDIKHLFAPYLSDAEDGR